MYFVVSADRAFNLTVSLGLPHGVCGFRGLSGIGILSNDASDGKDAILCFTRELDCPLFQLL